MSKQPTTRAGRLERSIRRKQRLIERENVTHKECSLCNMYLPISKFRVRKNYYPSGKDCIVARCRKCEYEMNKLQCDKERKRQRERKSGNPERYKRKYEYKRQWLKSHPGYDKERYHKNIKKSRGYSKKYRDNNLQKVRDSANRRNRKKISNLTPQYIKGLLAQQTGLSVNEIPTPLIKLKQLQIMGKRILKQKTHESQAATRSNV